MCLHFRSWSFCYLNTFITTFLSDVFLLPFFSYFSLCYVLSYIHDTERFFQSTNYSLKTLKGWNICLRGSNYLVASEALVVVLLSVTSFVEVAFPKCTVTDVHDNNEEKFWMVLWWKLFPFYKFVISSELFPLRLKKKLHDCIWQVCSVRILYMCGLCTVDLDIELYFLKSVLG